MVWDILLNYYNIPHFSKDCRNGEYCNGGFGIIKQ